MKTIFSNAVLPVLSLDLFELKTNAKLLSPYSGLTIHKIILSSSTACTDVSKEPHLNVLRRYSSDSLSFPILEIYINN